MEILRITDRIIFVKFKNLNLMAKTALRIGEHHDHRKDFNNDKPTFRQFLSWYKNNMEAKPYARYFQGLTLQDMYIRHFILDYKPKEYLWKEKELIDGLASELGKKNLKRRIKFAVIMCSQGQRSSVFKHELAHAMTYIDYRFQKALIKLIKKVDHSEMVKMRSWLIKKMGYFKEEVDEEIACRLIEKISMKELFGDSNPKVSPKVRKSLRNLLDIYLIKHENV